MSALPNITFNTLKYLRSKLEVGMHSRVETDLNNYVQYLIFNPSIKIIKPLTEFFKHFGIAENIASTLAKSFEAPIVQEREVRVTPRPISRKRLEFKGLNNDLDIVRERVLASIPQLQTMDKERLQGFLEIHSMPLARLLGSNVAEALVIADPAAVIHSKTDLLHILNGDKDIDPIAIANRFTKLSDEQRTQFSRLLSDQITTSLEKFREQKNLSALNPIQWLMEELEEHWVPAELQEQVAKDMLKYNTIQQLINMPDKQFRILAANILSSI